MELTVKDRIVLSSLFPPKGNVTTLRLVQDLISKVGLSAEETTEAKFRPVEKESDQLRWDNNFSVDIEFKTAEQEFIIKLLRDLSEKGELVFSDHGPLYEKFIKE